MMTRNTYETNSKTIKNVQKELLEFIRGKKYWSELSETGIEISFKKGLLQINRKDKNVMDFNVHPTVANIAEGLLAYKSQPQELKEWSALVLGLPFIDLGKIDNHTKGNELKEILWDLSFGTKIDQQMISFVESLQKH